MGCCANMLMMRGVYVVLPVIATNSTYEKLLLRFFIPRVTFL